MIIDVARLNPVHWTCTASEEGLEMQTSLESTRSSGDEWLRKVVESDWTQVEPDEVDTRLWNWGEYSKAFVKYGGGPDKDLARAISLADQQICATPDFEVPYCYAASIYSEVGDMNRAFKVLFDGLSKSKRKQGIYCSLVESALQCGNIEAFTNSTLSSVMAGKNTQWLDKSYLFLEILASRYKVQDLARWASKVLSKMHYATYFTPSGREPIDLLVTSTHSSPYVQRALGTAAELLMQGELDPDTRSWEERFLRSE